MCSYIESAKEAIRQLPESSKYIISYHSNMHALYGVCGSVMRCDRQCYDLECFVSEEKNCIVLQISLPFSYEEDRWEDVSGYLDCINDSKKTAKIEDIKEVYTDMFSQILVSEQNEVAMNSVSMEYFNNRIAK